MNLTDMPENGTYLSLQEMKAVQAKLRAAGVYEPFFVDMYGQVEHFHECAGHPYGVSYTDTLAVTLAKSLIDEEHREFMHELNEARVQAVAKDEPITAEQKAKLTKELCDLIWVSIDASITLGLPLERAFQRVYESNMSKINPATQKPYEVDPVTKKVKKGPVYKPAELGDLFHDSMGST